MTVFHMLCNESVCRAPLQLGCLVVGSPVTFVAVGEWALHLIQAHHGGLLGVRLHCLQAFTSLQVESAHN